MFKNYIELLICFFIAIPTSFMTPLGVLNINFNETKEWDDVVLALKDRAYLDYVVAGVGFLGAQHTLFSLNKLFLFKAFGTMGDFFKLSARAVKKCKKLDVVILSWILFVWCVLTSLVFGENGKDTLSFVQFGAPVGFVLSFLVHFVTRYQSVMFELKLNDKLSLDDAHAVINTSNSHKSEAFGYSISETFLASLITFVSFVVVAFSYTPGMVQGLETLVGKDIDAKNNYHGFVSIIFSSFALVPTMFFYLKAIFGFPKSVKTSLQSINNIAGCREKTKWSLYYLFDLFSAVVTALGYELIAESAIDSYNIKSPVADSSRYLLVSSITFMLTTYLFGIRKGSMPKPKLLENASPLISEAFSPFDDNILTQSRSQNSYFDAKSMGSVNSGGA